jgi:D-alanyl-D-alanine carboxypeptidase
MRPPLVNRAVRRLLLGLFVVVVAFAGLLGGPLLAAPANQVSVKGPPAAAASPSPAANPTASSAVSASPVASPSPGGTQGTSPAPGIGSIHRTTSYRPTATATLRAALDAALERLRAKAGIPGISATILFSDGSTWQGSAGLADVAARRPVTPDTAFPAASISKTFTAALILALVHEGRLGLDAPVTSYLPALRIDRTITVRQLLDHRSGLRDFYFGPGIDKALLSKPALVWDAARSLRYVGKPFAKPGTSWHYSNTNYLILGLVAQAVAGASVADQLQTRFLTPLGLDHTYYQSVEAPLGPVTHAYRFTGASLKLPAIDVSDGTPVVPFTSVVTAAGAAGSIATTSGDLARWARELYQGAALDVGSRIEMLADALQTARYKPSVAYGLGVQVVRIGGHLTFGHSGRFLGAQAAFRWVPDQQVAIAVMTNQSRSDPGGIVATLLRLALTPPAPSSIRAGGP